MTTSESEQVVVNSHRAWGKADHETDALCKMLEHWRTGFEDTELLHVIRYTGTVEKLSLFGHVEVDGVIHEAKAVEVDGDDLEELAELVHGIDSLADKVLAEAEPVEPEDAD